MKTIFINSRAGKTLLLVALLFTLVKGFSQTYVPFPTENGRWLAHQAFSESFTREYELVTDGKQIINGIEFTRLTERELVQRLNANNYPDGEPIFRKRTYGFFRNDTVNHKVFLIRNGGTVESIWFDFTLGIGDTVNSIFDSSSVQGTTLTVLGIDSILINGNYRKRFDIGGSCNYYIEGIGSTAGLGGFGVCLFEASEYLVCAEVDFARVYPEYGQPTCGRVTSIKSNHIKIKENLISIFPNPASSTITFTVTENLPQLYSVSIFNSVGKKVYSKVNIKNEDAISVLSFTDGVYYYRVTTEKNANVFNGSFVKQ